MTCLNFAYLAPSISAISVVFPTSHCRNLISSKPQLLIKLQRAKIFPSSNCSRRSISPRLNGSLVASWSSHGGTTVRACIRPPFLPSPCMYQIFCFRHVEMHCTCSCIAFIRALHSLMRHITLIHIYQLRCDERNGRMTWMIYEERRRGSPWLCMYVQYKYCTVQERTGHTCRTFSQPHTWSVFSPICCNVFS